MENNIGLEKALPTIYKGVAEFDTILAAETELFIDIDNQTSKVEKNQFVQTADITGLQIWERALNIIVNPANDTIQFRKERVLNRLRTVVPLTVKDLRNRLDHLLGDDNYELNIIYSNYLVQLETQIGTFGLLPELIRTLFACLPANMELMLANTVTESGAGVCYTGQISNTAMIYTIS